MIKNSFNLSLLLLCFSFTSCSIAEQQDSLPDTGKECVSFGKKYYLYNDLNREFAGKAMEGDVEASRKIVVQLLEKGGDGASDPLLACQLIFWTELSAQNGSLHSAYELATFEGVDDGYRCRRSKHWASVVLSRIEEFRADALPDSDKDQVERSIIGRRDQMQESLRKKCSAL